jgi:hypothetical protein
MIKAELTEKTGYRFCFKITDGDIISFGGLTDGGILTADAGCQNKEFMLRVLINKCMNDFIEEVKTEDIWGVNLERFGFKKQGGLYVSGFYSLRLPHGCSR